MYSALAVIIALPASTAIAYDAGNSLQQSATYGFLTALVGFIAWILYRVISRHPAGGLILCFMPVVFSAIPPSLGYPAGPVLLLERLAWFLVAAAVIGYSDKWLRRIIESKEEGKIGGKIGVSSFFWTKK